MPYLIYIYIYIYFIIIDELLRLGDTYKIKNCTIEWPKNKKKNKTRQENNGLSHKTNQQKINFFGCWENTRKGNKIQTQFSTIKDQRESREKKNSKIKLAVWH